MLKTYYRISFELVIQILGGLFPKKINVSDAKLTCCALKTVPVPAGSGIKSDLTITNCI